MTPPHAHLGYAHQVPMAGHISPHMFGHASPINTPIIPSPSPQTIPLYHHPMAPVTFLAVSPIPFEYMTILAHTPDDMHVHHSNQHQQNNPLLQNGPIQYFQSDYPE